MVTKDYSRFASASREFAASLMLRTSKKAAGSILGAVFALGVAVTGLQAQPTGGTVVAGDASIATAPGQTTVTAGNNSMLQWDSFNIPLGQTVQFVQPGADARVLNWIGGVTPSQIDGSLLANGQVYLVNPYGVYFGQTAIVDVAGLYAAAGQISKEDFLNGMNRFTSLSGEVNNAGSIRGEMVALVGRSVVNSGTIVSPGGFIGLASGDEVLLGQNGSSIYVNAGKAPPTEPPASGSGVANTGKIDAGRGSATLAAGDFYSIAITQNGQLSGRNVKVQGQGRGDVLVNGNIDTASSTAGETGGRIEVTGNRVALTGNAKLDASGPAGGGTILVGGDFQGKNPDVRNASQTYVGKDVVLKSDAIDSGNGGKVITWADDSTRFFGSLSAQGGATGGNGGFAEISGKQNLTFAGSASLSAPFGNSGTLLLDPNNLYVGVDPSIGGVNELTTSPFDASAAAYFVLAANLVGDASYILTAANDVIFNAIVAFGSAGANTVSITAGNAITSTGFAVTTAGGAMTLDAPTMNLGAIDTGVGNLTLDNATAVTTTGNLKTGGTLSIDTGTLDMGGDLEGSTEVNITNSGAFTYTSGQVKGTLLTLNGAGQVGTGGAPIVTDLTNLVFAKSGGGATYVSDVNSLSATGSTDAAVSITTAVNLVTTATLSSTAGGITLTSGTMTLGAIDSGTGLLTIDNSGAATQTGIFAGSGGLTKKNQSGVLTLSQPNTYTGLTTIDNGPVTYAANDVIATGAVTVNGGFAALNLGTFSDTVGTVTLTSNGSITSTTGTLTTTGTYEMQAGTVSAILAGAVPLNKTTGGTVFLSGTNTYTGVTTISGGVLSVPSLVDIGLASTIGTGNGTNDASNAASLVLDGGTLQYTGGGNSTTRLFTLTDNGGTIDASGTGALVFTQSTASIAHTGAGAHTLTFTGTYTGANQFTPIIGDGAAATSVTKTAAGNWILSGTNTYTGVTTLTGGTLTVSSLDVAGSPSNIGTGSNASDAANAAALVFNGGTLRYTGAGNIIDRLFTLTDNGGTIDGSGTGALDFDSSGNIAYSGTAARTLTLTGTNSANNLTPLLADNTGATSLTKNGSGTWNMWGANTYTGATTVNAGTLAAQIASVANTSGAFGNNSALTLVAGGTVDITGASTQIGSLAGAGGTFTLGGQTLTLGDGTNTSYAGVISGAGGITKIGTGTLTLSGSNTYGGATNINAGTLIATANNALGDNVGETFVASGATLGFSGGFAYTSTETVHLNGTGDAGNSRAGAFDNISGNNSFAGTLTLVGGGNATIGTTANNFTHSGPSIGASDFTYAPASGTTITESGVLSGAGTNVILNGAGGTLVLSNTNTYTGDTTIKAGTLVVGANAPESADGALGNSANAVVLGDAAGTANVALLTSGAVTVGRDISVQATTAGTSSLGGSSANTSAFTGDITLNKGLSISQVAGGSTEFSGAITGAFTLTLANVAGTAILSGDVDVSTLSVDNTNLNVEFTGNGSSVTNAVAFDNTGTLKLGQDGGTQTYDAGLDTTGVDGVVTLNGVLQTTGDAIGLGAVTLGSNTELTGSTVTFGGAVTGNTKSLDINGDAVFGTAPSHSVTGVTTLDVSGTTKINADVITTTGTQVYTGAVTIASNNTTLTTTDSNVTFSSNINADSAGTQNRTLTIDAGTGTVRFDGNIGNTEALADLDVTAGSIVIAGAMIKLDDDTAAATAIFRGAVKLESSVSIQNTSTNGANVTFNSTVDGSTVSTENLSLDVGLGNVLFSGLVGDSITLGDINIANANDVTANGVRALSFVQADGTGTTTLNQGDFTAGTDTAITAGGTLGVNIVNETIAVNGNITTSAGSTGDISLNADTGALTMADGTVINSDDAVTLVGKTGVALGQVVTNGGAISITATTGNITDNTATNGAGNENIVTTSGVITLTATTGNIGATGIPAAIDLNLGTSGTLTTTSGASGAATDGTFLNVIGNFNVSGITSARNIEVNATGAITNAAGDIVSSNNGDITLVSTGSSITLANDVQANGSGNVTLNANSLLTVNADVSSTSGNLSLSGRTGVTLGAAATAGSSGTYTVNADSNADASGTYTQTAGSAVSTGAVQITAADVDLAGTISAGAANVTILTSTSGATIGVGSAT
ncbi:MAG TPA: autotransporter-associated beta strand repeat-containing protein, partial [Lacunisphaera sp.]|nr:autotransporter-associated beta strand repeat-containing protein [Lacunisphaera sp.]